jgi:oxygen-independent coproporphyrinogen-3 oxidase
MAEPSGARSAARLRVDEAQILRLSGSGPRYTSYPTAPVWSAEVGEREYEAALARAALRAEEPLSLYVHLPFCARLCLFCGCTVEITRRADRVTRYLAALEREIELVAARLAPRRRVAQLHWGGGTPTHLGLEELAALFGALARRFEILPGAELSIEVHPHVTSRAQIDLLTELGFERFSMGVQDTDPGVQAAIHRDQTLEETAALIAHCRARGVRSINLDLLYGLPAQDEGTFEHTLADVADLAPDRLAVYGYAHVPWLKPFQRSLETHGLPDAPARARLFALAVERLSEQGYELLGLDHFARAGDSLVQALREGRLHRNFQGYTDQRADEMVAFGMSAIGDLGGTFAQNARDSAEYEARLAQGRLGTARGLVRSPEDDLRRAAIQALMCRMRLDLGQLEAETGRTDLERHFAPAWRALEPLAREGLCRLETRRVEVLPTGRLFLRHFAMAFDEYLARESPAPARFSQTI